MQARTIVLDANILIRAILGIRVRQLILDHAMAARFFAPDVVMTQRNLHRSGG
ncbi:PIN domain-containing protein [Castellaniella sp.]|uniref:PIN domain-containing protein n=1 Tax=Castellaniella sp. TaxID=1955812 RepID=UPI002AFE557D|nr:PIN domain-containing protein [Castellaniella sp.]